MYDNFGQKVLRGFTTGAECRQTSWIHLHARLYGKICELLPAEAEIVP